MRDKIMETQDATILIVDGCNGIYSAQSLLDRYPIYLDSGAGDAVENPYDLFQEVLENDPVWQDEPYNKLFHPDNEHGLDNQCAWIDSGELYVRNDAKEYWRIEWNDGDIIAVNPNAVWSDETESYEARL